jgi:hypothetical protein
MVKAKQTWTITDHNELSNTLLHTQTEGEPVVSIVRIFKERSSFTFSLKYKGTISHDQVIHIYVLKLLKTGSLIVACFVCKLKKGVCNVLKTSYVGIADA